MAKNLQDNYKISAAFDRLPIVMDWCYYKDEIIVAQINWDATKKAGKPMMDISYCMTRALNQCILKTVQWDKNKFKRCHLTHPECELK